MRGSQPSPRGDPMPPHTAGCMVCGPEAPGSYGLEVRRRGQRVTARFTFGDAQAGSPGLAHGGGVAAVCDDLLGHVLMLERVPAVTRRLEVDYLRPVVLGQPYDFTAWCEAREGRKLWLSCSGVDAEGNEAVRAQGLFVQVGLEHFLESLSPEVREAARRHLAEWGTFGGAARAW